MTNLEAIKILDNLKPGDYSNPYEKGEAIVMAIPALKAQDEEQREEPLYCDRDICLRNEYNGIGCEECEVMKSQKNLQQVTTDTISRQAAIEAICDNCDTVEASCPHYPCGRYVAVEKLPSAQLEPQWIPVSEMLPDEFGDYLVSIKSIGWNMEEYVENDIAYWDDLEGFHKADEVLAWMPLPEPYRAERRNDAED